VDHLHHLLAAAAASLDGQHGVVEGAHQLAGSMGEASGLDTVSLIPCWITDAHLG
jgi:hypothetical protein